MVDCFESLVIPRGVKQLMSQQLPLTTYPRERRASVHSTHTTKLKTAKRGQWAKLWLPEHGDPCWDSLSTTKAESGGGLLKWRNTGGSWEFAG